MNTKKLLKKMIKDIGFRVTVYYIIVICVIVVSVIVLSYGYYIGINREYCTIGIEAQEDYIFTNIKIADHKTCQIFENHIDEGLIKQCFVTEHTDKNWHFECINLFDDVEITFEIKEQKENVEKYSMFETNELFKSECENFGGIGCYHCSWEMNKEETISNREMWCGSIFLGMREEFINICEKYDLQDMRIENDRLYCQGESSFRLFK